jgi:hypothetical protein
VRTRDTVAIQQSIDEGFFGRREEKIRTDAGAVYDNDGVRLPGASAGVMVQIETEAVERGKINDLRRYPMTHGHSPLGQECTIARNKINALPVRNRGPVAFSSIIGPCRPSARRMRAALNRNWRDRIAVRTSRKIFDNGEDRHAGQPETAGDQ